MDKPEAISFCSSAQDIAENYKENNIILKNVSSWKEFKDLIDKLNELHNFLNSTAEMSDKSYAPIFRGHSNANWKLISTLERVSLDYFSIRKYYLLLLKVYGQMKSSGMKNLPEFLKDYSGLEQVTESHFLLYPEFLAYVRHFGFPSPLLDWSRSPYVSAFFAFNECDKDGDIAIYSLLAKQLQSLPSNPDNPAQAMTIDFIGEYLSTHKRHFLQQSNYTVSLTKEYPGKINDFCSHTKCITAFSAETFPQAIIFKFILPASEKLVVLRELDKMNINSYTLFGSDESLLSALFNREALFKD